MAKRADSDGIDGPFDRAMRKAMREDKKRGVATAHTVTDSQIRELARTALTASQYKDCRLALLSAREALTSWVGKYLERTYPTRKERTAARARCAALLNARTSEPK